MEFREFFNELDAKGMITRIKKEVDPRYEIGTIMKKLDGRALLFENVKGHDMPVLANICATREQVALGLGIRPDKILDKLSSAIESPKEPGTADPSDYQEVDPDLSRLPILTYYPGDGGPYVASGIVIAEDGDLGMNASYQRAMILGKDSFVMRILPRDFNTFLEKGNSEFAFCIGNSIPVMIASAVSTRTGNSELAIANALGKTDLVELGGRKVPQAEIVIIAENTGKKAKEGPFLDLTETPDIVREERVMKVKKIFVRKDAVFHALLPGGLEHKTLMGMPREPTIFREVAKECDVKDVLITPGGCSWLHAAVSIKKKKPDDGKKAIESAFAGHKSMKHVFVVDDDVDIHDPNEIEWAMATRFQGNKDIVMKEGVKGSSLDPSSDTATRETCKMGFDLTIPSDKDPKHFKKPELPMDIDPEDYLE